MLHNPERTLAATPPAEQAERLARACAVLEEATAAGLCRSWGIASWDPRPLITSVTAMADSGVPPRPAVLMLRAGLLVAAEVMDAAAELATRLAVTPPGRWGMSPFGGDRAGEVWDAVNVAQFLGAGQAFTPRQAAFRIAYELPTCARVAVGTNTPAHLGELVAASTLRVDTDVIARYRQLLGERSRRPEADGAARPIAVSSPVS
jgi:aryl-alcohol dehydrogenase-like predicted oxidoreductase